MKRPSSHWLDTVFDILHAESGDLKQLAQVAGADPREFYKFQSLAACDLRGQDLRGLDLTGCELNRALINDATQIDKEFDPRAEGEGESINFSINRHLNQLMIDYSSTNSKLAEGEPSALRSLIDFGVAVQEAGDWNFYARLIEGNEYLTNLMDYRSTSNLVWRTVHLPNWQKEIIETNIGPINQQETIGWVLLIGAVSRRVPASDNRDHSSLLPTELFSRKVVHA